MHEAKIPEAGAGGAGARAHGVGSLPTSRLQVRTPEAAFQVEASDTKGPARATPARGCTRAPHTVPLVLWPLPIQTSHDLR